MRIRKLLYDSFFVNSVKFSGVTSVDSLTSDLYFHFTDKHSSKWKLSGNTAALASGAILENSDTLTITALINGLTGLTAATGATIYTLTVVNQDGVNVKQESITAGGIATTNAGIAYLDASKNVTVRGVGSANVTVTHPDIVTTKTLPVIGYYPTTSVVVTPAALTGTTTGQTQQLTVVNEHGYNLTAQCTFVSSNTNVATVNASSGLVTFIGNIGDVYITATHTYSGVYARPTTIWRFQP